jgi:hypothetical protein
MEESLGYRPADTGTIPFSGVNKPAVCHHQQTQHNRLLRTPSLARFEGLFAPGMRSVAVRLRLLVSQKAYNGILSSIRNVRMMVPTNQQAAGCHHKITRSYPGIGDGIVPLIGLFFSFLCYKERGSAYSRVVIYDCHDMANPTSPSLEERKG